RPRFRNTPKVGCRSCLTELLGAVDAQMAAFPAANLDLQHWFHAPLANVRPSCFKPRQRFGSSDAELKCGTALKLRRAMKKLDSQTFKFASYVRINLLA